VATWRGFHDSVRTRDRTLKKFIVFDLDGTLAPSKSPLDAEMSTLLHVLLGIVRVGCGDLF
jgi:hypothetical protein